MDTLGRSFNEIMQDLSRRIDANGLSPTQWEEGYTSEDVEESLEYLQMVINSSLNVDAELVMVWDSLDIGGVFPTGDSEIWILSKLSDGYVGAPITTPFIASDALEGFLNDVLEFSEGTLQLKPVSFVRFSTFNMIRTH